MTRVIKVTGQDQTPGGAGQETSLDARFSNPRGPHVAGLGLSDDQVHALVDFLENGLYDEGFVKFDPRSPTDSFFPNVRDLSYSKYHPSLAAKGAVDGQLISGLGFINNDPLSRRDLGIDPPIDVTAQLAYERPTSTPTDDGFGVVHRYAVTNTSKRVVDTHLLVAAEGLTPSVMMLEGSGAATEVSSSGVPYARKFLSSDEGTLQPGASTHITLVFYPRVAGAALPSNLGYALRFYSGQGSL
jgi:hypothetical protein